MNENEPFIIETSEKEVKTRNRFPVFGQILIISVILIGLFSGLLFSGKVAFLNNNQSDKQSTGIVEVDNSIKTEVTPQKINDVSLIAKSAFVWDVKEQRVLFQKNEEAVLPLASITKLMTALVAYELLPDDTKVKVTKEAASQQSGGSLKEGEVFLVKELADFALVSSYNSAAYTLADAVGNKLGDRDPVAQFVASMNIRAKELKLDSLEFINPTGLDISTNKAGAYGSAKDVSFLMEYILENYPNILEPTRSNHTKLYNTNGDYHEAKNTNNIVDRIPNLIGSKTGYTDLAGGNLTIALNIGLDHPVVITVLGSTIDGRVSDVSKLIEAVQKSVVNK